MTGARFRQLLWAYVVLLALETGSFFFPVFGATLPAACEVETETWLTSSPLLAGALLGALALAWLAGFAGLFLFKAWARPLALYSTLAGYLIYPSLGMTLASGFESMLAEASATVWGAILALAYFSTVIGQFGAANSEGS